MSDGACAHAGMVIEERRIGNVSALGRFVTELQAWREDFPILLQMLEGRANGGHTEAKDCALALEELETFRRSVGPQRPYLVDAAIGETAYAEGIVCASYLGPHFLAVRRRRLLVVRGGERFAAMQVINGVGRIMSADAWEGTVQWSSGDLIYEPLRRLPPRLEPTRYRVDGGGLVESWGEPPDVGALVELSRLTDRESGTSVEVSCALPGKTDRVTLQTRTKGGGAEDNAWVIGNLVALCTAAVSAGQPLEYW